MIINSLLAATLAALALIPTAGQDVPSTRAAPLQAASVQTGPQAGSRQATNYPTEARGVRAAARLYPSSVPPRPHFVAGYTPHALENMAARHITKAQVEALIASPIVGSYQDDNDTWLVTDGNLIAIINKNAYIVTGFGKD